QTCALPISSQEGIKVDLVIRGICCMKPGIKDVSDNIRVISVVGRFLEHSRIYYFYHNGDKKMFLSSADMMTRNMIKRVEILFPINDPRIVEELIEVNELFLRDNVKARVQLPDGTYEYVKNDLPTLSVQDELMKRAVENSEQKKTELLQEHSNILEQIKSRFRK